MRVDNALSALKPPMPPSTTAASEPPVTIASALPRRMVLKASIRAWVELAHADTVA